MENVAEAEEILKELRDEMLDELDEIEREFELQTGPPNLNNLDT